MKKYTLYFLVLCAIIAQAEDAGFIRAYDLGEFDKAAGEISNLDISRPEIARRLGVMYYKGQGVSGDKSKGLALMESAMLGGDSMAALNLAKIYYKFEANEAKATWCLLVARKIGGADAVEDINRMYNIIGQDYEKNLDEYIRHLHKQLQDENDKLGLKTAEFCRAIAKSEEFAKKLRDENGKLRVDVDGLSQEVTKRGERIEELQNNLRDKDEELRDKLRDKDEEIKRLNGVLNGRVDKSILEKLQTELSECKDKYAKSFMEGEEWRGKYKKVESTLSGWRDEKLEADRWRRKYEASEKELSNLKRKYERLVQMSQGDEIDPDVVVDDSSCDSGPLRGLKTLFCAPCNYIRVGETAQYACTDDGFIHYVSLAFCGSLIAIAETVPVVCDVVNGVADAVTLGAYGDWLYDGSLTPDWQDRDNTHFPWLDER